MEITRASRTLVSARERCLAYSLGMTNAIASPDTQALGTVAQPCTHLVKLRRVGDARWHFLTHRGGLNRLRVHAAQFDLVSAKRSVQDILLENEGEWEAKTVRISPRGRGI